MTFEAGVFIQLATENTVTQLLIMVGKLRVSQFWKIIQLSIPFSQQNNVILLLVTV